MDPPRQGKLDHQSTDLATRYHYQLSKALERNGLRSSYFQLGASCLRSLASSPYLIISCCAPLPVQVSLAGAKSPNHSPIVS